ncbi:PAS domain-containing sensor histidine kinase [Bradyrhizobium sp. BR 1432]|uniref:PAS domain-containing sensor histidine kinase n=1 Tax=Bradyrhizobium sp. BR 1432 TaxID=3447966 RepID=UPI003EE75320
MVVNSKHSAEQRQCSRCCINDLNRILAHPPIWSDGSFSQALPDLLDIVVDMLHLDFAYVRLKDPVKMEYLEVARTARSLVGAIAPQEVSSVLSTSLGQDPKTWPLIQRIAIGERELSTISLHLGWLPDDTGMLVAASHRAEFPEEAETLRLRIAANQIASGLQEARLFSQRTRVDETTDQEVWRRTKEILALSEDRRQEIVELRRVVESLRVREIDIQLIVDAIPAPLAIMTVDGEVEAVNRPVLEYFGMGADELKRWSTTGAVHPDDVAATISTWRRAVQTGEPYEVESRHRRSDGVYRWFSVRGFPLRDKHGDIVRWCVLQIDVEERKRAEEALRANERNLNLIINTIPGLVWSASADGSADFVNQHYADYVGFDLEHLQGSRWTAAIHPDDRSGMAHAWRSFMTSRRAGEREARLRRFDGTYRWFLFRANPLLDESGNVIKWFGINTDIEDRKRAEEQLRDTQTKLAHMARMTTMSELTASIAHEVNQPLSGIVTNASTCLRMLAADPPNVAGALETVRRTLRDGNRASDIIGRLRSLFNRKAPVARPVDLNEATREVIPLLLNRLHRDGVSLRMEFAEDLPLAAGDRVQLQQVILNLLQNAMDAMSMIDDRPRTLTIRTEREQSNWIRLSVQDSGHGFDGEAIEKLFDAFYTTKDDGMGIGLSVSRSIIENHHGRLWASLNDGWGATFSFSIPRSAESITSAHSLDAKGTLGEGGVTRNV